ncbi:hypothetical protein V6N11_082366 [Hibiscus sabdariffa]|uniref:Uncharacterized protein n=1 Tax=Hibiscus sabdariffa TaxID=183260 RepID=A0ABR2PCC6_9ROSI
MASARAELKISRQGRRFSAKPKQQIIPPGQQISHLPRYLPRERVKLRPRRLPKLDLKPMRKEDDLDFSTEGYCVQARQAVTGLRDKPVTQHDALPNSEVPTKISARAGLVASLPRHPLCHPVKADYQSSALQNRRNCNRLPHYDAT